MTPSHKWHCDTNYIVTQITLWHLWHKWHLDTNVLVTTQMTPWHKWLGDTNDSVTQMTRWHKWHIWHHDTHDTVTQMTPWVRVNDDENLMVTRFILPSGGMGKPNLAGQVSTCSGTSSALCALYLPILQEIKFKWHSDKNETMTQKKTWYEWHCVTNDTLMQLTL